MRSSQNKNKKTGPYFAVPFFLSLTLVAANAVAAGYDALSFKPANDQGYYLTVEQSKTLGRMGHAIGFTGDYSFNSLELRDASYTKIQDVIQKQVGLNLGGALGLTDWLDVGVNIGGVAYQQFVTPGTLVQDNGSRLGDIGVNMKAQLIDSEKSIFGLALVPFLTFPTGDENHFTGNSAVTGGGKVILDTKRIGDRVSFALNAGGQVRKDTVLTPGATVIDDQFLYGAAMNVEISKPVQFIAETNGSTSLKNLFEKQSRNLEIDGALRFLPGKNRNFQITAGGGAGLLQGAGVPDYRAFTTVALRFPKHEVEVARISAPDPIREEVISTSDVHFAFNKSVIQVASYPVLERILVDIRNRPEVESVRVEGHTDHIGSDEYNQKLSEQRAHAVRVFLIKQGYPAEKISAVGVGESSPIDDNTTKEGRAQNRRVEFHLQVPNDSHVKVKKSAESSPAFEEGDRSR